MSIVYKFRLTKMLHDQVTQTGRSFAVVLNRWDEADYANLCDYLTQCREVVPKYVRKMSEILGESPRSIVGQVLKARFAGFEASGDSESESCGKDTGTMIYLPEDTTDRTRYLQRYCGVRERYI